MRNKYYLFHSVPFLACDIERKTVVMIDSHFLGGLVIGDVNYGFLIDKASKSSQIRSMRKVLTKVNLKGNTFSFLINNPNGRILNRKFERIEHIMEIPAIGDDPSRKTNTFEWCFFVPGSSKKIISQKCKINNVLRSEFETYFPVCKIGTQPSL